MNKKISSIIIDNGKVYILKENDIKYELDLTQIYKNKNSDIFCIEYTLKTGDKILETHPVKPSDVEGYIEAYNFVRKEYPEECI